VLLHRQPDALRRNPLPDLRYKARAGKPGSPETLQGPFTDSGRCVAYRL